MKREEKVKPFLRLATGLSLFGLLVLAQNSNLPSFELNRENNVITVQQTATDNEGGFFVSSRGCEEEAISQTIFAPSPLRVETRINDTLVESSILLREQPAGEGGQDEAILNMSGGSVALDDINCPTDLERSETADVTITEGRTIINGVLFDYDNANGVGDMTGPVKLERAAEGDSPALSATSEALTFDTDNDDIFLNGSVVVTSEDRISEAEELEYDEENSIAVMTGSPATSRDAEGFVQGETIIYYLNSNDVVVKGDIAAEIEIDLGEGLGTPGFGGSSGGSSNSPNPSPEPGTPDIPTVDDEQTGPQTAPEDTGPAAGCDDKFSGEACEQ